MDCDDCDFVAKNARGLALHRRAKHPDGAPTSNLSAVEQTLEALRSAGRLEPVDAAHVQALRSMAAALDANPFNSQMWKEYREAIGELRADDGDDGEVQALLDRLSAPARDTS